MKKVLSLVLLTAMVVSMISAMGITFSAAALIKSDDMTDLPTIFYANDGTTRVLHSASGNGQFTTKDNYNEFLWISTHKVGSASSNATWGLLLGNNKNIKIIYSHAEKKIKILNGATLVSEAAYNLSLIHI